MNNTQPHSKVIKRSLSIKGHRTSISLEEEFWTRIKCIACQKKISIAQLVAEIDSTRRQVNLSSALRVFVLSELIKASELKTQTQQ
jgi:predicted DNA-binding ribbon-helix-helix protein